MNALTTHMRVWAAAILFGSLAYGAMLLLIAVLDRLPFGGQAP